MMLIHTYPLVWEAVVNPSLRCDTPLHISNVYRVQTDEGIIMVDNRGRVVQIQNFVDPHPPRKLTAGDTAFAAFEDTLSVFSDVAFRIPYNATPSPSLVITHRSDSHGASVALFSHWQMCYTVKEREIQGLKVGPDCIYTTDGLSLYNLVTSWKSNVCLIFDECCREEIVRTLCALAIGDCKLGRVFKLKCVLPDGGKRLDLRDLDPLQLDFMMQNTHGHHEIDSDQESLVKNPPGYHREDLTSLRDMIRLPSGFSILTENENVVVLRHILRDAMVIVPGTRNNSSAFYN